MPDQKRIIVYNNGVKTEDTTEKKNKVRLLDRMTGEEIDRLIKKKLEEYKKSIQ
jgi:hypothetical protein